jgi:uncharacterized membrane protein
MYKKKLKIKVMKELVESIQRVQEVEGVDQATIRIKELKFQIRKLEVIVVVIGLIGLSLIVLPFFGILAFNLLSVLTIVGGGFLIRKAFKDGEPLEVEKFFLELMYTDKK